ncbi:ankyrin repeat domain-containing protein [Salmonella enterica]|nr:ankyrin repeat domain-containing protein [Salmonella enterica]EJH7441487.1 ankyrin repeat domain-containing protein [Salmonella enterica]EJH7880767.1 ankyrin repeat domain-containing protein [Salmonella enterica]EJI6713594.1 ankyrin repeat domain-containing protein [Salmonella enterica]
MLFIDVVTLLKDAIKNNDNEALLKELNRDDPHYSTRKTRGLLSFAAKCGQLEICKTLLDFGLDINEESPDAGFSTPLVEAAGRGFLELVYFFVRNGSDIDGGCRTVITPLSSATIGNHIDVVRYLLKHNADINRPHSKLSKTALDFALDYGFNDIVCLLKHYGGVSLKEPINWETEYGGSIIEYVDSKAGKVFPNKITHIVRDAPIDLRMASIKNKYKLLFTIGLFKCKPRVEYFICLPDDYYINNSMKRNDAPLCFPVQLLFSISDRVFHGEVFVEGDLIKKSDHKYKDMLWPSGCDGFVVVDHSWHSESTCEDNDEDIVLLYMLIPISLENESLIEKNKNSNLVKKLRSAPWSKISLTL